LQTNKLTLLVAPASSQAGNLQVVARSLETALHKLYELKFDLGQIVSGYGTAPLPPVAADFLGAIGRTNDAILYGGQVVLWVKADDKHLSEIGPQVPSSSSRDHGAPFAEIFARYEQDFYRIDPLLFSPAVIVFHNLRTGKSHVYGRMEPQVLRRSFGFA
jgi:methenyltetrahydromethanopterin cyclohydrolase